MSSELRVRFAGPPRDLRITATSQPPLPQRAPVRSAELVPAASRPAAAAAPMPAPAPAGGEAERLRERLLPLLERLAAETERAASRVRDEVAGLEPALVRLALAIAGKVVRTAAAAGGVDVPGLVHEALTKVTQGLDAPRALRVRVHPDDADAIRKVVADHPVAHDRARIEADPAQRHGTALIDCDLRRVVVDVEHELERLQEALCGGSSAGDGTDADGVTPPGGRDA